MKSARKAKCSPTLLLLLVWGCFLLGPAVSWGQGPQRITLENPMPQKLTLNMGKSVILTSPEPVKRVSLAAPEIADAMVLTPRQIYLTGKAPGVTNLTLWTTENNIAALFDVEVTPDVSRLKEALFKLLPDEREIKVLATNDSVTLSGTVSSSSNFAQAAALAESYFPKKVINLLQVGGVHQVMLEVRVAEMSRTMLKRLGVNFNWISNTGATFGVSMLNNLTRVAGDFPVSPVGFSDRINILFRFLGNKGTWTGFIDALKEEGLTKVLAEPTLITLSGKSANFLAGGEFPIPVPQPSGVGTTITIQYKPFGVGLWFTPTVLSGNKINIQVAPEVSDLDFTNAIQISGFVVPSLTTRRVSTSVELADGQSFAIAGLLRDNIREVVQKFPVLGDIPILGALFRSTSFQKSETELIVIVTPHLVKPLDLAKQTLPTDQYIEPDDFEFYLLGKLEGQGPKAAATRSSALLPHKERKLEGPFGHIIPK